MTQPTPTLAQRAPRPRRRGPARRWLAALIAAALGLWGCTELADPVRLEGAVRLEGQDDHSGATVRLRVAGSDANRPEARTDAQGRFVFGAASAKATYTLEVTREGYDCQAAAAALGPLRHGASGFPLVQVACEATARHDVEVRVSSSAPSFARLEDVQVSWLGRGHGDPLKTASAATLGADGAVRVAGLAPGPYTLEIRAAGHAVLRLAPPTSSVWRVPEDTAAPIRAVLDPGVAPDLGDDPPACAACQRVAAAVRDEVSGAPLAGVVLALSPEGGAVLARAVSQSDGAFAFDGVPQEVTYGLTLEKAGYLPRAVTARPREGGFALEGEGVQGDGEAVWVALTPIRASWAVSGRLTSGALDPGDLSWAGRAVVTLTDGEDAARAVAVAPDGGFSASGLSPRQGPYALTVVAQGHLHARLDVPLDDDSPELIALGEVELAPDRAGFEARVLDGTGAPLRGAAVSIRRAGSLALVEQRVTGEAGGFGVALTREPHALTVAKDGYVAAEALALDWREGCDPDQNPRCSCVSPQSGRACAPDAGAPCACHAFALSGPGVDAAGEAVVLQAVPSASLVGRVVSTQPAEGWTRAAFATLIRDDAQVRRLEPILPDGSFQFAGLPVGTYDLSVSARNHRPLDVLGLALGEGERALEPLVLTHISETEAAVPLDGVAWLEGEDDHSGIVVRARDADSQTLFATTLTDASGAFSTLASPSERYTLSFEREGWLPLGPTAPVVWDAEDARFEGEDGEPLRVTLLGAPLRDQDRDGIIDTVDNCPQLANGAQDDGDGDGRGDVCDPDRDGDGVPNGRDNCPGSPNGMQALASGSLGDRCVDLSAPFRVACAVVGHTLDTRGQAHRYQGSCGGAGAPEAVYEVFLSAGEPVEVQTTGRRAPVLYARELATQSEVEGTCVLSTRLDFVAPRGGRYQLVVDSNAGEGGRVEVDVRKPRCARVAHDTADTLGLLPSTGDAMRGLALGDLNEDGWPDLAIAHQGRDGITVYLGDGQGRAGGPSGFGALSPVFPTLGRGPTTVTLLDADEDGHLDVATYYGPFDDRGLDLLLGRGDGTFGPATRLLEGTYSVAKRASADVDQDGHADLVVGVNQDDQRGALVLFGAGDGTFEARYVSTGAEEASFVWPLDVTGDGRVDLVSFDTLTAELIVTPGRGDRTFDAASRARYLIGFGPSEAAWGDVDRDGLLDVAVLNADDDTITVLLGGGAQGRFRSRSTLPVETGVRPGQLEVADLDHDGNPDLVGAAYYPGRTHAGVFALYGRGDGTFSPRVDLPNHPRAAQASGMAVGDVNGDGAVDLFTAFFRKEDYSDPQIGAHYGVARETTLDVVARHPVGALPVDLAAVDLSGDGALDYVTADYASDTLSVVLRDGATLAPAVSYATGPEPISVSGGDFNRDGRWDVAVAHAADATVAVWWGDGTGDLAPGPTMPTIADTDTPVAARRPRQVLAGDADADGIDDLLVAHTDPWTITWLRGRGDGAFDPPVSVLDGGGTTVDAPESVALIDLNGDGRRDLVAKFKTSVRTRLRTPTGWASARQILYVQRGPTDLHHVDMVGAGDGVLDLIAAPALDTRLLMFRGDGTGSFRDRTSSGWFRDRPLPGLPSRLEVLDWDGDGRLDVVVSLKGRNQVAVMRNTGTVSAEGDADPNGFPFFDEVILLPAGDQPAPFDVVDLDGDGAWEVVTANAANADLSVTAAGRPPRDHVGTTLGRVPLAPCPDDTAFEARPHLGGGMVFVLAPDTPCRMDRAELALTYDADDATPARLDVPTTLTALDHPHPSGRAPAQVWPAGAPPAPGLLRAERLPALARFEGALAAGRWLLQGGLLNLPGLSATLHVNRPVADPFQPRLPSCAAPHLPSPADDDPAMTCLLSAPLDGAVLEDAQHPHTFVLDSALGGLTAGQTLRVEVTPARPAQLRVELRAMGGDPIATAAPLGGVWTLDYAVPAALAGRYFAVRVQALDPAEPLMYRLEVTRNTP